MSNAEKNRDAEKEIPNPSRNLSFLRKWVKRLSLLLLTICIFVFLFLVVERLRGQISLARYKKALIASGEKISPADFFVPVSKEENGMPTIAQALSKFKPGLILRENYPPRMELLPSGRAVVGFREKEWIIDKNTNSWAELALEWKTNKAIFLEIKDALDKPAFNSELDYSQGYNLLITNLISPKTLVTWFGSGSQLALHDGDNRAALKRLLPQIRTPHLIETDRLAISELVRFAVASIAKMATWEAMQAKGWTDDDLNKIQAEWRKHDFIGSAAAGFEGELVYEDASYQLMRKSNDETFKVLFEWPIFLSDELEPPVWEKVVSNFPCGDELVEFLQREIFCRVWRFAWSHQHQLRSAKQIHRLLEITRDLAEQKSYAGVSAAIDQLMAESEQKGFLDSLRFPEASSYLSLAKVINKAARAQTECSSALCAIAVQRYALREGKFPAELGNLIPEFLPSVPTDYFDGKPMKYFLNVDGSFTLYSVGENGEDDHADSSPMKTSGKIARSIWDRNDAIWPAPATSDEVAAFRAEKTK